MIKEHSSSLIISSVDMDFQGSVDITDPAYGRSVWCRINDIKISPGKYVCIAERLEFDETYHTTGRGGKRYLKTMRDIRISRVAVVNSSLCQVLVQLGIEEFDRSFPDSGSFGFLVEDLGKAGVDTARLGFFHDKPDDSYDHDFSDTIITDSGFITRSGLGEGSYKVTGVSDPENPGCRMAVFVDYFD